MAARTENGSEPFDAEPSVIAALLNDFGAGLYTVDDEGRVTWMNAEGERLLGHPPGALVGQAAHDVLHSVRADGTPYPVELCPLLDVLRQGRRAESSSDVFLDATGGFLPVAWVSTPLTLPDLRRGAVVMFRSVAEQVRLEREREQALEAERAGLAVVEAMHVRLRLLAEASAVLTSTLDMDEGLSRLSQLVVPRLADWCVVDTVDEEQVLHRVALAHPTADRASISLARTLPDWRTSQAPLAHVLRGSGPVRLDLPGAPSTASDELAEVQFALLDALGAHQAIVVPLAARGQVFGALTLARTDRAFSGADFELAEDLGRRAGLALDNARLYSRQRAIAETLQRSLLTTLPQIEQLDLAARYVPAGRHSRVGGDWYDAFLQPDGSTALVIGDIAGHNVEAAARMGQVRNLLRGIAVDRHGCTPGEIVRRLDVAIDALGAAAFATTIFGKIVMREPGVRELWWSSAGHPPPLLVHADGRTEMLAGEPDLPLGVLPGQERRDLRTVLPPGSTVLLYTDGLVEHRGEDVSVGLTRLRQAAAMRAAAPVEQLCDEVLQALGVGPESEDDVALLAIRVPLK